MVVIAFVHPDLGIGGAERLICDAALALQKQGHNVKIYTSHHDTNHCFKETKDGTLNVITVGDWLPRHLVGRFYALWAYIRMIYVSLYLVLFAKYDPDVIICDQISACIPALKISKKARIVFYCHFPDMLLTDRKTLLKKLYRIPLDWLEEFTTGLADVILVNSNFTAQTFCNTFKSLLLTKPVVLYPSLNFDAFDCKGKSLADILKDKLPLQAKYLFLSINRYERKKNLALAINSLRKLKDSCSTTVWKSIHLVMAGGYDERVEENKSHYVELESLATRLGVKENITFLRSFSDKEKVALLQNATCLLYTPSNEHFGIVPIEAMYMHCPVIACDSGGPLETIENEVTGYLCAPNAEEFSKCMLLFIEKNSLKQQLGNKGHQRVIEKFSFNAFTAKLDDTVNNMMLLEREDNATDRWLLLLILVLAVIILVFRLIYFDFVYKVFTGSV